MTLIQSKSNEALRRAYLRELGVQPYFPRRELPGAKPSLSYAEAFLKSGDSSVAMAEAVLKVEQLRAALESPVQPAIEQVPALIRKQLPDSNPPVLARPILVEPPASKPPSAKPIVEEDVRFAFAYFPINEELAVINELPWAKSAAVAPSTRQLLASILKAVGVACEEKDLSSMVFSWPMPDMPLEEQGAESARLTLEGFLGRRFKLRPIRNLLVLAEQSASFLFPPDFSAAEQGPLFKHPHFDVSVTLTRSLNAMEAVPEIKRVVWQALQPLKAAFDTGSEPRRSSTSSQDNA